MSRPILNDITVVIPTLGRSIIRRCIRQLIEGSAWPFEVIVVDQGNVVSIASWMSDLNTPGMKLSYLPSSTEGRSAGLNLGLERVRTHFAAITDDDCCVHEDWMANLAGRLRANPDSVIAGHVINSNDMAEVRWQLARRAPVVYQRPSLIYDRLAGGNMGLSMNAFRKVGAFDEDPLVRFAEDREWAYRALRSGVSIAYARDVVVLHGLWRDETQRVAQLRNYARSHGGFYGKYLRRGDLYMVLRILAHHTRALWTWTGGVLRGNRDMRFVGGAYFTGLFPGILAGLRGGPLR